MRVDRFDASGDHLDPVPVEIRGLSIAGQVNEGEEVVVSGRWEHGTLVATELANLTTGAAVRREAFKDLLRRSFRDYRGLWTAVLGLVALFILFVIVMLVTFVVGAGAIFRLFFGGGPFQSLLDVLGP